MHPSGNLRKASPAGCAVSLVGIALLITGCICIWGSYVGFNLPEDHPSADLWPRFAIGALISLLGAVLIFYISWKMTTRSDMSDPLDPEKPKVRW